MLHNFTDCCIEEHVPSACVPYCNVLDLVSLKSSTNAALTCFHHMKSMIKCLSDGRNHRPCCQEQKVPEICQSACVGKYDLTTVYEHVTCLSYAAPILSCISVGVETLPPPPKGISATALSKTEIRISWTRPRHFRLVDHYMLHMAQEQRDESGLPTRYRLEPLIIPADDTEYLARGLTSFSMYEVYMTSVNRYGESVPTNTVRLLTRTPVRLNNNTNSSDVHIKADSSLINLRKCCMQEGLHNETCLNLLCNPTANRFESMNSKVLSCIPYANISFKCMAASYKKDSECCQARGLSSFCQTLCQPVQSVDYRHAICFHYYPSFLSCYMENADVLPSEPTNITMATIHHHWATIHWTEPTNNVNSIDRYVVHWKVAGAHDSDYTAVEYKGEPPFLLDKLSPNRSYEVYVTAANKYGYSRGSSRLIFTTEPLLAWKASTEIQVAEQAPKGVYNETACCEKAGMSSTCLPLCTYDVKVDSIITHGPLCLDTNTAQTLVRCSTGGRDHRTCCAQRFVPEKCLNLCAGVLVSSPITTGLHCAAHMTKILLCLRKGAELLPGMPVDLYASKVTKNNVDIHWKKSKEDQAKNASLTYSIRYRKIKGEIPPNPTEYTNEVNVTKETAVLRNLLPASRYSIHVVSNNEHGSSLPSLVLIVLTPTPEDDPVERNITSRLGAPHSLEVVHQTYNSLTLRWLPPLYIAPEADISYQVYYRSLKDAQWKFADTYYSNVDLHGLEPNTNYAIKVLAKDESGVKSHFSEVIVVRTDPVDALLVSPPQIFPKGPLVSGSNVSILCESEGTPVPNISILVNGVVTRREEGPVVWHNITNLDPAVASIGCYATNGVGGVEGESAQESISVVVKSPPRVDKVVSHVKVMKFEAARLLCVVNGVPTPVVSWYRDNRTEIVSGPETKIFTTDDSDFHGGFAAHLVIKRVVEDDGGTYTCRAVNELGSDSHSNFVEVIAPTSGGGTETQADCCINSLSNPVCKFACTEGGIDIDGLLRRSECIPGIGKMLRCAYNDKDNRECCKSKGVPESCRDWCYGEGNSVDFCLIGSAKDILTCFTGENGTKISGPGPGHGSGVNATRLDSISGKPRKSSLFMVILFIVFTLALAILIGGAMVYYHKIYKLRNSDNNNDDNIIGFENQTYLKDTDSVILGSRQS